MLITFILLVLVVSCFEILSLVKRKLKKELVAFCCFSIIILAFGYFYLSNPFRSSLSYIILSFFNLV